MKAHGSLVIAPGAGLTSARSEPPFSIRQCGDRVLIASSAAAPVGGDELSLALSVLPDAQAHVGTVASTVVLPGPTGAPSTMSTTCTVGAGAHLEWVAEPTISVAGSDHTVITTVDLDDSATCRVSEEVSLGRTGESSGRLRLIIRVTRGGQPLVHHDELFGPHVLGAGSLVSVGTARHVLSEVRVGIAPGIAQVEVTDACRAAWLPIADDAALLLAVGQDRPTVQAATTQFVPSVPAPALPTPPHSATTPA